MLEAISAAASGMRLAAAQLAASADNTANDEFLVPPGTEPYRSWMAVATARPGLSGVAVTAVRRVAATDVDPGRESVNQMLAVEDERLSAAVVRRAGDAYRSVLALTGN